MDDLVSLSEVSAKECAVSQIEDWSKEMPQLRTLCMSRSVHFGQEMMRHSELLPVLERMTYCMPMGAEEAAALQKLPCLTRCVLVHVCVCVVCNNVLLGVDQHALCSFALSCCC